MDPDKIRKYLRAELKLPEAEVESIVAELANEKTAERADETADLDTEAISAAIIRHLLARGARSAPQPTPTPTPTAVPASSEPTPLAKAQAQAIDLGVDPAVVKRAADECDGDAGRFGLAIRKELQRTQEVPEIKTQPITGGHERKLDAFRDMSTILLARSTPQNHERCTAAAKVSGQWRRMSMLGLIEVAARADNPRLGVIHNPEDFLREQLSARFAGPVESVAGIDGARFVRAGGELVPADLPAVYASVLYKNMRESYERARIPYERVSRREDVVDFRDKTLIWYDIAGQFNPLATGELLRPVSLRDQSATFRADRFGHILCIGLDAIVNDDMGIVAQLPMRLGDWCGSSETTVFEKIIAAGVLTSGGSSIYTGDFDLDVGDPTTSFAADLETVRQRALQVRPVAPGANEDPRSEPGRTRALVPTVMLHGRVISTPWERYSAETMRTFDARAETIRTAYEKRLYENSHEGLSLPPAEYFLYPGPDSPFCPVVHGRVRGQEMTLRVFPTAPEEQDGLKVRCFNTFGAGITHGNAMYRVR